MLKIFLALWLAITPAFAWAGMMLTGVGGASAPPPATTTWDPANVSSGITLSGGNLIATYNNTIGGGYTAVRAIANHSTGKYYCEILANGAVANINLGIEVAGQSLVAPVGDNNLGIQYSQNGQVVTSFAVVTTISAWGSGNLISIAVDFGNSAIWFRVDNGNWNNSGTANPATNTGGISISSLAAGPYFPAVALHDNGDQMTANFGATAYAQSVPASFGNW